MKHKEIAKAWLDGAEVECRQHTGEWALLKGPDEITHIFSFDDRYEYRIRPKTATIRFKVYKHAQSNEIRCVDVKACCVYDMADFYDMADWVCISDEQTLEVPIKI